MSMHKYKLIYKILKISKNGYIIIDSVLPKIIIKGV